MAVTSLRKQRVKAEVKFKAPVEDSGKIAKWEEPGICLPT